MNPIERLAQRIQRLRGDALLVEGVLLVAGIGFLVSVSLAGDPGWYAIAWTVVLVVTLVAPEGAHALLPLGVLTWWFAQAQVGSAYSLPAAWCLLAVFTCLALLTASPDGMPLSRVVMLRYASRAMTAGALTTLVWALAMLVRDVRETYLVVTIVGFAALALALIALPRLLHAERRATDTD